MTGMGRLFYSSIYELHLGFFNLLHGAYIILHTYKNLLLVEVQTQNNSFV